MNILIKSAVIVDPTDKQLHLKKRDILISKGVITKIATKIDEPSKATIISQKNLHVSLGWVDTGICFGEPGFEDRETISNGLQTAAKSGFTNVILNPSSYPVPDNSSAMVFLQNASKNQATTLHPVGALTKNSEGADLAELYDMQNAGAVSFYDYKHAISNPNILKIALQYAQNFDALIQSFPLDTKIAGKGIVNESAVTTALGLKGIPTLAEELQIARDLFILEYTGGKLHIPTISTAGSVKLIADAKKKGLDITCSTTIQHIWFTDKELEEFETNYKVMPPLRSKQDQKALIKGLKDGVIDFVTTDHTPLNIELKEVEFDNAHFGSLGLESAFGILNQLFDTEMAVQLLTKGRERFKLNEVSFTEGSTACLTLFDPIAESTFTLDNITSTSKNSMFLNSQLKGKVVGIVNNKQLIN